MGAVRHLRLVRDTPADSPLADGLLADVARDERSAAVLVVAARPRRGEDLEAVLDAGERARLAALRSPEEAVRFVAAHALLRTVVGEHLGLAPTEVTLTATCTTCGGPHGRPEVVGHPGLHVGLSHGGEVAVVALSTDGRVGVDVETHAAADFPGFGSVALGVGEPDGDGVARATTWVRKEAVLKATGDGLAVPPAALRLSPPDEPPRLLGWDPGLAGRSAPAAVRLADLDLAPGHAGCVAVLTALPLRTEVRHRVL